MGGGDALVSHIMSASSRGTSADCGIAAPASAVVGAKTGGGDGWACFEAAADETPTCSALMLLCDTTVDA